MAGYEGSPYKQDDVAVGPSVGGSKQQFDVPVNKIKRGLRKTTLWHISVSLVSSIFIFLIFQCALQLKSTREQRGTARRLAGQVRVFGCSVLSPSSTLAILSRYQQTP